MTDSVELLNNMQGRILQAEALRKEGKTSEADALDPTPEEMEQVLRALRERYGNSGGTTKGKKAPALPDDLSTLFG